MRCLNLTTPDFNVTPKARGMQLILMPNALLACDDIQWNCLKPTSVAGYGPSLSNTVFPNGGAEGLRPYST